MFCSWMQNDLDRMLLPDSIRRRIQTAMPVLFPSARCSISCQLPSVSPSALASLQPSISVSGFSNPPQRHPNTSVRNAANIIGKSKPSPSQQDLDPEIDPWTLLEDGAGSGSTSSNSALTGGSDTNLKASHLLKGAVRMRRMDLSYIGSVDEDS